MVSGLLNHGSDFGASRGISRLRPTEPAAVPQNASVKIGTNYHRINYEEVTRPTQEQPQTDMRNRRTVWTNISGELGGQDAKLGRIEDILTDVEANTQRR